MGCDAVGRSRLPILLLLSVYTMATMDAAHLTTRSWLSACVRKNTTQHVCVFCLSSSKAASSSSKAPSSFPCPIHTYPPYTLLIPPPPACPPESSPVCVVAWLSVFWCLFPLLCLCCYLYRTMRSGCVPFWSVSLLQKDK
jgi:hypothetical protein